METKKRLEEGKRITFIGLLINILLTVVKLLAGSLGKSAAMLADGIHSLSDIITDVVVVAFVSVGGKESDQNHHYGHGKFETFAVMLISFTLLIVGIGISWEALKHIISHLQGSILDKPRHIALYAALASIIVKELLFWWTIHIGKNINNEAVIANAWHHRSDAFSSIGTAVGISGAIFLGPSWRLLDPLAGMIVSVFIIRMAWNLGIPSINELLETALPEHIRKEMATIISSQDGVKGFHRLRTRKIGSKYAIELHVKVEKTLSVEESHQIATNIENALRKQYGQQTHIGVHIEPFYAPDETH
ncbi:MAG: cation diffusion facilitator family transporter [Bacteroidales bacterium]|nr:cation diffusion facilitator family transporter [Bacteroidales bacterium]